MAFEHKALGVIKWMWSRTLIGYEIISVTLFYVTFYSKCIVCEYVPCSAFNRNEKTLHEKKHNSSLTLINAAYGSQLAKLCLTIMDKKAYYCFIYLSPALVYFKSWSVTLHGKSTLNVKLLFHNISKEASKMSQNVCRMSQSLYVKQRLEHVFKNPWNVDVLNPS